MPTSRLNILVTARWGIPGVADPRVSYAPRNWNTVCVRNGYSGVEEGDAAGRPLAIQVATREIYDPAALNALRQPGAYRVIPDAEGIARAVAELRAAWGDLHVQDNSGAVPHLHQGMFRG